jgi:hypothetical protein
MLDSFLLNRYILHSHGLSASELARYKVREARLLSAGEPRAILVPSDAERCIFLALKIFCQALERCHRLVRHIRHLKAQFSSSLAIYLALIQYIQTPWQPCVRRQFRGLGWRL